MQEQNKKFNKEIEAIKKKQNRNLRSEEYNNWRIQQSFIRIPEQAKKRISEPEARSLEII